MTIDEAIIHCEEVATRKLKNENNAKCVLCGEEHVQLAKWLKELKDYKSREDVVPVVHAYWIPQKENNEFKEAWMKCSACGYPVSRWTGNTNFCPNCGADMRGEQE